MKCNISVFLVALLGLTGINFVSGSSECEVCVTFVDKVYKTLPKEDASSVDAIKRHLVAMCSDAKGKDKSLCYNIGGLEESATGVLMLIARPMSYTKPALKICREISKQDSQICQLQYDKPIDLKNVDLKKMKVRDLKKVLSLWEETCTGCVEKSDYIQRIEELKPNYMREEL